MLTPSELSNKPSSPPFQDTNPSTGSTSQEETPNKTTPGEAALDTNTLPLPRDKPTIPAALLSELQLLINRYIPTATTPPLTITLQRTHLLRHGKPALGCLHRAILTTARRQTSREWRALALTTPFPSIPGDAKAIHGLEPDLDEDARDKREKRDKPVEWRDIIGKRLAKFKNARGKVRCYVFPAEVAGDEAVEGRGSAYSEFIGEGTSGDEQSGKDGASMGKKWADRESDMSVYETVGEWSLGEVEAVRSLKRRLVQLGELIDEAADGGTEDGEGAEPTEEEGSEAEEEDDEDEYSEDHASGTEEDPIIVE